jgi:hypothetical protein
VGRHSAPPSGARDSRRPLYLAVIVAVVVLAVAVVSLTLALRGDGDDRTTADPGSRRTASRAPSSAALASGGSLDPSVSAAPSTTTTTPAASAASTPATPATPSTTATTTTTRAAASASSAAATTAAAKPKRPPTLRLEWLGTSYVRVRVGGGGGTVFEKIGAKGTVRTFDQHSVTALIGNASEIRVVVNGKQRKPGAAGQIATIVARR